MWLNSGFMNKPIGEKLVSKELEYDLLKVNVKKLLQLLEKDEEVAVTCIFSDETHEQLLITEYLINK